MTFDRPDLLALAPLAVLLVALGVTAQWRRGLRLAAAYGGARAAARLAERELRRFPTARLATAIGAAALLAASAAGPRPAAPPPESEEPIDLVIALDVSLSMTAADVAPSRAARASEVLDRIAEALPAERLALAVFADWPYTLVPPTDDLDVVRYFVGTLSPDLVADRDQGTGLPAAVTHARATLETRRRPDAEPVILLLSDGEYFGDETSVLDSVAAAARGGTTVWVGGLGTTSGGVLTRPGSPGDPLVDETGQPVVARLDEALLRRIAEAGGGRYFDVGAEAGLGALLDELAGEASGAAPLHPRADLPLLLALLALPLLFCEGTLDTSRRGRALLRWARRS